MIPHAPRASIRKIAIRTDNLRATRPPAGTCRRDHPLARLADDQPETRLAECGCAHLRPSGPGKRDTRHLAASTACACAAPCFAPCAGPGTSRAGRPTGRNSQGRGNCAGPRHRSRRGSGRPAPPRRATRARDRVRALHRTADPPLRRSPASPPDRRPLAHRPVTNPPWRGSAIRRRPGNNLIAFSIQEKPTEDPS